VSFSPMFFVLSNNGLSKIVSTNMGFFHIWSFHQYKCDSFTMGFYYINIMLLKMDKQRLVFKNFCCSSLFDSLKFWRAPKFLIRPKMGPSHSNSRIVRNSRHVPSSQL
jgi:hypothetical protein